MLKFRELPIPVPPGKREGHSVSNRRQKLARLHPSPSQPAPLKRPRNPRWMDPSVKPRRTNPCSGPNKLRGESRSGHVLFPQCPQLPETICCPSLGPADSPTPERGPARVGAAREEKWLHPCTSQVVTTYQPGQPYLLVSGEPSNGGPSTWAHLLGAHHASPSHPSRDGWSPGTCGRPAQGDWAAQGAGTALQRGRGTGGPGKGWAGCGGWLSARLPRRPSPSLGGRRRD